MITKFVYQYQEEIQESLPFTKVKKSKKKSPILDGHIFKVRYDGELEPKSLCGKTKQDIGKTIERENRVVNLPVCPECAEAWKNDPESEWQKFIKPAVK